MVSPIRSSSLLQPLQLSVSHRSRSRKLWSSAPAAESSSEWRSAALELQEGSDFKVSQPAFAVPGPELENLADIPSDI